MLNKEKALSLTVGKISETIVDSQVCFKKRPVVLILGAGRVCRPAAEFLASIGNISSNYSLRICQSIGVEEIREFQVIVASLYKKDAEEVCFQTGNSSNFFLFLCFLTGNSSFSNNLIKCRQRSSYLFLKFGGFPTKTPFQTI